MKISGNRLTKLAKNFDKIVNSQFITSVFLLVNLTVYIFFNLPE